MNPEITDVHYDSRKAAPQSVFVAVPGHKAQGDTFIADAVSRGAAAVVSHNAQPECPVPWAQVGDPREAAGTISKLLWAPDFVPECSVGITGTNGKTTTAALYHELLARRFGRSLTWLFGTISYVVDGKSVPASNTTPEAADVFRMIGTAPNSPAALVMEVSSHALALERLAGLRYNLAVWTNLTQDHLDFHKSFEEYYGAKKKLFVKHLTADAIAVLNADDKWSCRLASEIPSLRHVTFGESASADVRIVESSCDWDGSRLQLDLAGTNLELRSPLTGSFNRYNIAAFCAGAHALAYGAKDISATLEAVSCVSGRMERVRLDAPFAVVVDYAHTPDALTKLLATVRDLTSGRVITLFGCGGDRDRTKRPLMAEIVAQASDEAIVTSDNPRTESASAIIDDILRGVPLDFPHHVSEKRDEAIRLALSMARDGDCVVVAGKGHENYQEINGERHPFDDREVIRREYARIAGKQSHD